MPKIERQVTIASLTDKVWEIIADLGEMDMWSTAAKEEIDPLRKCIVCGGNPHELPLGSEARVHIIGWDEGRRIGYRVTDVEGVNSMRIDIAIRPEVDGTAATFILDFDVNDPTDVSDVVRKFELYAVDSLACLNRHVETS